MNEDFISKYLHYIGETEAPTFYHRWSALSMVGAYLERQYYFPFVNSRVHTNMYVMLIGDPGARKSTAIKAAKKILSLAGYTTISADKSSKEKFLLDLAGIDDDKEGKSIDDLLDENLWGKTEDSEIHPMYIACDEFNDFVGLGNMEFISLLGSLWDFDGPYINRIKTGKSVNINDPTISILGGNTPVSFASAFPPETLGQGFFSRLLLIQGETTGKRITFPKIATLAATNTIVRELQRIKLTIKGEAKLTQAAEQLLDKIYHLPNRIEDPRFVAYFNRRLTHLLKLCLIISACDYSNIITDRHVVVANTLLTHTEHLMPKALGQFGKGRSSDITHKIMGILCETTVPLKIQDIWKFVHNDMEKLNDLVELLRNLLAADKIFNVAGAYLGKARVVEEVNNDMLDYSYLTEEERGMKK